MYWDFVNTSQFAEKEVHTDLQKNIAASTTNFTQSPCNFYTADDDDFDSDSSSDLLNLELMGFPTLPNDLKFPNTVKISDFKRT